MTPVRDFTRASQGILFLISFVAGSFGEFYVLTTLIVSGDPTATFNSIAAQEWLFRFRLRRVPARRDCATPRWHSCSTSC